MHKRDKFFNPIVVAPGVTVDQVVSLKEVPVPEPLAAVIVAPISNIPGPGTDLNFQPLTTEIVQSHAALVRLGKALFWDMQVGSDGVTACATCHFNAGADVRSKNQISPNLSDTNFHNNIAPNGDGFGGDNLWGDATVPYTANDPLTPNPPGPVEPPPAQLNVPGFPQFGPNYEVTSADFPINDWFRPTELTPRGPGVTIFDEFANVARDTNDIMASQGVRLNLFCGVTPGSAAECSMPEADIFNTATPGMLNTGGRVRRAMPRNAPTMINAVFNFDNLWDGKASFVFNGVNPFGFRDRSSTVKEVINGVVTPVFVRITNSSLASVAAGVPTNNIAMSFDKRTFSDVGKKMVSLRPLAKQFVHPQDSVLGNFSRAVLNPDGTLSGSRGLKVAYEDMVKAAFQKQWWDSPDLFNGYTQMQANFSLFFGLAVQAYEATLVSDNTPFDRFMGAPHPVRANHGNPIPPQPNALTERQRLGLSLFEDDDPNLGTHCADCHVPPVTTGHTVLDYQPDAQGVPSLAMGEAIEFMIMGDNAEEANYDHGMYNIGVRRSCITGIDPSTCPSHTEDKGRGATANKAAQFMNPLIGTNVGISSISRAAVIPPTVPPTSTVTVTTATSNPLAAGQFVTIFGVGDASFNGVFAVATVISPTQFTYLQGNLPDSSSSGGSATGPNAPFPLSLVELTALRGNPACAGSPIPHVGCLPPDVARFIPDVPMLPRRVTNGAFKAPNLRNIKFSGPYFHVGDSATLRQVVEFYTRGGNFPNTNLHDKTVDVEGIPPFAFPEFNPVAEANIEALVDFLAEGLKDDRVAFEKGPFDHPELRVPNGSPKSDSSKDLFIHIPAVGSHGRATELPTFLGLDPQQP
ncbi:MAG TPA: hypothetical protein VMO80_10370 [Terriglobales bacterium]|nr:hypothetical protein [Terriglobales bacterium]